jgi:hypothetical protein
MKSNVNNNRKGLVRLSLLLLGTCVLTATMLGAGAYSEAQQQTESNERDALMLDRLMEARRANLLLQCLSRGKDVEARQLLTATLNDDLQEAKAMTQTATPGAVTQALCAIKILERDEKAHPELYASLKPAALSPHSIQLARHETKH